MCGICIPYSNNTFCAAQYCMFQDLDGDNKLKFYWIDLVKAIERSIEDPSYLNKLYHAFEMSLDENGVRVFDRANSGLVFESFQLLDPSVSPILVIIASDASHQGNTTHHPLYCEL